jgi:hypothetical protein
MSKAQVLAKAAKLGCVIEIDNDSATLLPPKGKVLGDSFHISIFEFDTPKSVIWDTFLKEMEMLKDCEVEDCVDKCQEYLLAKKM